MEHPNSITARILKRSLPEKAIVNQEAKQILNTAATIFTHFLATTAHDASVDKKRLTVTLTDVINALEEIEFGSFVSSVESCVVATRVTATAKKNAKKESADSNRSDATLD
uniref:Uncharacterized protein AlNc14C25G2498 n=1 Tax=Albugo laibachii Nc14 TaxID=890382 RepID=F0W6K9_9STRA|nr:conserved hypothetical protein [Albugo laibachii Nc14]|eukprot:CCA16754.1 conserved hypothetical protein [Albugo laibachii Nc14]